MITGPRMDEITDMDEQTALICCCFSFSLALICFLSDEFKEVLMDLSDVHYKHHNTVYVGSGTEWQDGEMILTIKTVASKDG